MPPPPEEIPQLDFLPKKAKKDDDGNQGTLGGFVGSIMGGGGGHQQDLEEGLLIKRPRITTIAKVAIRSSRSWKMTMMVMRFVKVTVTMAVIVRRSRMEVTKISGCLICSSRAAL